MSLGLALRHPGFAGFPSHIAFSEGSVITPIHVHETVARHQFADGLPIVPNLEKSRGVWLHDDLSGEDYLDAFTSYAAFPIGYNHPDMEDPDFRRRLMTAALMKIANANLYTTDMADFVEAFATRVTPPGFPHHFWIATGALAVENALKVAFDWKARKLGRTSYDASADDLVVVHFERAFHGRSGYTLALTNTSPEKVGLFPRFRWPRIHSPGIEFDLEGRIANDIDREEGVARAQLQRAFREHKGKVAAIIIEPIQCEGGDRHFRPEFMRMLREFADAEEAMLIFDEVQTGFFASGKPWMWQHHGVAPDIVAFGKKTQVCGIYCSKRVEEVENHVFAAPSRIGSTWGGSLVDMVRSTKIIEIVERHDLGKRAADAGRRCLEGLRTIARETGTISNVRGRGTLIAFTAPKAELRNRIVDRLMEQRTIALPCGPDSVRYRLPLTITDGEVDEVLKRTATAIHAASPSPTT